MTIPRIRSESPAFDLHHPEVALMELGENEAEGEERPPDAPDVDGREEMLRDRIDDDDTTAPRRGRPPMKAEAWIFGITHHLLRARQPRLLVPDATTGPARPRWS